MAGNKLISDEQTLLLPAPELVEPSLAELATRPVDAGQTDPTSYDLALVHEASADAVTVWTVVPICVLGVFIVNVDTSLIMASSQNIASEFNALESASWMITSYGLAQSAIQPLYGKLSTIFGRRLNLAWCYLFFAVGCFICAIGEQYWQLIAGRVISGIGGAGMTALVSIIIADLVPVRSIAMWRSFVNIAATLGRSMGGPIGGILTDTVGWRWSFMGQVPLTVVSMLLVLWKLPRSLGMSESAGESPTFAQKLKRVDVAGTVLLAATISGMLLTLDFSTKIYPWYLVLITAIGTVLLGISFIAIEHYVAAEPIVPLELLTKRPAWTSYLFVGTQLAAQTGIFYTIPIYFQIAAGTSVAEAGLHLVPAVVGNAAGGIICGFTIARTARYKYLTVIGIIISIAGYTLMLIRWTGTTNWVESSYPLLGGFGMGFVASTSFVNLAAYFDSEDLAITGTMLYVAQNIFAVLGVQLPTAVLHASLLNTLNKELKEFPDKAKVIEQVTSNVRSIHTLPTVLRAIVAQAYVTGVRYTYGISIILSAIALIAGLSMQEGKI